MGQRNFATMLLNDDLAAAAGWYRRAAEQGDAFSQDKLSQARALAARWSAQDRT